MNIRSAKTIKVMPIVGVRPQIIKSAPVLRLLDEDEEVKLQLVHSGQHYDFEMLKEDYFIILIPRTPDQKSCTKGFLAAAFSFPHRYWMGQM